MQWEFGNSGRVALVSEWIFPLVFYEKCSNSELMMQISSLEDEIENGDRQREVITVECHKFNDTDRHFISFISLVYLVRYTML